MLTQAQMIVLKAFIEADSTMSAMPHNSDSAAAISELLKVDASPVFVVWKTSMMPDDYIEAIDWAEVESITAAKAQTWQWITSFQSRPINAALPSVRSALSSAFSGAGAANTRNGLIGIAKRNANALEKLFATGAGTNGTPGTMAVEGFVNGTEIMQVMGW